jgi:hypothetical protein
VLLLRLCESFTIYLPLALIQVIARDCSADVLPLSRGSNSGGLLLGLMLLICTSLLLRYERGCWFLKVYLLIRRVFGVVQDL